MGSLAEKVVTLESLRFPREQTDSAAAGGEPTTEDEREARAFYERLMMLLQDAADEVDGADVLTTVRDREASLAQSAIAEVAEARRELASGGAEVQFGTGFGGGDELGWILSLRDRVRRKKAHPILRPAEAVAETLTGDLTMAIASDWGTGLYGAPKIARSLYRMAAERGPFDLQMHLGDVYYSGTKAEVEDRFVDRWPTTAGRRNRALNGNHEMYSGGFGYFELILPEFGQESSYFAVQNEHWVLVGLDTAYVDHDVDEEQVVWLDTIVGQAEERKLVLFSHHQPFSPWARPGPNPPRLPHTLRRLLATRRVTAWYWGHEHQCVVYDQHQEWGLHGRCLGNGGIPERRKSEVRRAPADEQHPGAAGCAWRRLPPTGEAPGCLVLDGQNVDMRDPSDREMFGPHGFMTLEFRGPVLTERVHHSDGAELFSNTLG